MGIFIAFVGFLMEIEAFSKNSSMVESMRPAEAIVGSIFIVGGLMLQSLMRHK